MPNASGGVLGIDGASNRQSKSISDVISHVPIPLFEEYLRANLHRETTPNVATKIIDVVSRLDELVECRYVYAFISYS